MVERRLLDTGEGRGVKIELYEIQLKKQLRGHTSVATIGEAAGIRLHEVTTARQVRFVLDGGGVLVEPGALQYAHGRMDIDVQKAQGAGGMLRRRMVSAGTDESAFATAYRGHGEVWAEPTFDYFLIASMDDPSDALILDDGAFYACDTGITLGIHRHRSVSGVLAGDGLVQPKLEGSGVFIVEMESPPEDIEAVELDGSDELVCDGDVMLMYSASLKVELRPLVRGLRNAMRTGEGLVYRFTGHGTVWLTPTHSVQPH